MTGTLLNVDRLCVMLGGALVLDDVSIRVDAGEAVCLLGPNGAGKSTVMKAIAGFVKPRSGSIVLTGPAGEMSLQGLAAYRMPVLGVRYVAATENVVPRLTVEENLMLGGYALLDRRATRSAIAEQFALFPRLAERRAQLAGSLSGGEQKLVAIARALIGAPKLLLLDEPSIGLSGVIADSVFDQIGALPSATGVGLLIVEQSIARGLAVSDRTYVMRVGGIDFEAESGSLTDGYRISEAFFGASSSNGG